MKILAFYVLAIVLLLAGSLIWTTQKRKRRLARPNPPPPGFQRTDETFTDPTTKVVERVWYNPETGERWYEPLGKEDQESPVRRP